MKLVEQFLCGKHSAGECEDGIVVTPDFAAVIDGSTSKTASRIRSDMRNGRLCMLTLSKVIREMPSDITLSTFCDRATRAVRALYPSDEPYRSLPHERMCASVIVYSHFRHEVWMVGDCQCMVGGRLYTNPKPYEEGLSRRRAQAWPEMLSEHPEMVRDGFILHDYARDTILDDLVASMKNENVTYAVVDGFPIYKSGIRVVRLEAGSSPTEVVLASDGYPVLKPTLEESEAALHNVLAEDAYCVKLFPATKGRMQGNVSFDDRAYVRLLEE